MCVADFIFCLLVLPFDSIRFIDASWANVRFLCVLVPFLRYGNVGVSLLSVGAITINRYLKQKLINAPLIVIKIVFSKLKFFFICRYIMIAHHGIYARIYKKHWIAAMIIFCWLFSYGMQVPTLIGKWGNVVFWRNKIYLNLTLTN